MKKTLNIILFGRKKSYFVKCTLTLIGLYLGVLFWYFNVDYLGQPIQNALVLAVCSLICISVLVALYRIPEQLCVNSQIEKLLYFPVNPTKINRHSPYLSITLHKCYPYYLFGISTFPSSAYHSIVLRKFSITIV